MSDDRILSDPCEAEGVCGPNSLCRPISHSPQCYCPLGFISSPFDGCHRNNSHCQSTKDCKESHVCLGDRCFLSCSSTSACAQGEQCQNSVCVKVCYTDSNCQLGEVCVEGICSVGCRSDSDCGISETCLGNKCRCGPGFISGPTGCRDVNECEQSTSCHSTALCFNTPGSFRCECPAGTFSLNPREQNCEPAQECSHDGDCDESSRCLLDTSLGVKKCVNPCTLQKCGLRASCSVSNHKAECKCPLNHFGDPYADEGGCHAIECTENENCSEDKFCDLLTNRCLNPCSGNKCGSHALCIAQAHQGTCSCLPGFQTKNRSCEDIDECKSNPSLCHSTANCTNTPGAFICDCPVGTVGDPKSSLGCKNPDDCSLTANCPSTAACVQGKCKNVCEGACGTGTKCEAVEHKPVCSCLPNFIGGKLYFKKIAELFTLKPLTEFYRSDYWLSPRSMSRRNRV